MASSGSTTAVLVIGPGAARRRAVDRDRGVRARVDGAAGAGHGLAGGRAGEEAGAGWRAMPVDAGRHGVDHLDAGRVDGADVVDGQRVGHRVPTATLDGPVLLMREVGQRTPPAALVTSVGRGRGGREVLGRPGAGHGGGVVERRAVGGGDEAADRDGPRARRRRALPPLQVTSCAPPCEQVPLVLVMTNCGARRRVLDHADAVDLIGQDDVVDLRAAGVDDRDRVGELLARRDGARGGGLGDRERAGRVRGGRASGPARTRSRAPTTAVSHLATLFWNVKGRRRASPASMA